MTMRLSNVLSLAMHKRIPLSDSIKYILCALLSCCSLQLFSAELLSNGNMLNGASGWSKYPSDTTGINTITLGSIQFLTLDTYENGKNAISTSAYQKVSVKPNTKYRFSFLARTELAPVDMFIRIVKKDATIVDPAKNAFFDNYRNPTLMTRRVRIADSILTSYFVDFETGDNVLGEYALAFSGGTYSTYADIPKGQVQITNASLTDTPSAVSKIQVPATSNLSGSKTTISLDVNQAGYMGANKPFIFTLSGLPSYIAIAHALLKRSDGSVVYGNDGQPMFAKMVGDVTDLESNQRVITFSIDTTNLPVNLIDDLADPVSLSPAFGNRDRGYYIENLLAVNGFICVPAGPMGMLKCYTAGGMTTLNSHRFPISKNIYAKLSSDSLNYFIANTAGKASYGYQMGVIDDPFKREQDRAAGHVSSDKIATCRTGNDLFGNDFSTGCNLPLGTLDVHGGWYDAGDQGKYVVNGGVSLWTMQNMIERLQKKADALAVGSAAYNSLVSRVQSLMRISKDEMDFMLRMQAPTGTKAYVPVGYQGGRFSANGFGYFQTVANPTPNISAINLGDTASGAVAYNGGNLPRLSIKLNITLEDVSDMVFHSVSDENWTSLPTAPANDKEKRVLSYPTSAATLNMAAVAAQASRIWSWSNSPIYIVDLAGASITPANYASLCLTAAQKAYAAAKSRIASKKSLFRYEYSNDDWSAVDASKRNAWLLGSGSPLSAEWNGGGAYGDYRIKDEFYWASMELFLAATAKTNVVTTNDALVASAYQNYLSSLSWTTNDPETGLWSSFEQKHFPILGYNWIKGFEWQNVAALGTLSALTIDKNRFVVGENISAASTTTNVILKAASATGANVTLNSPQKNLKAFADDLTTYVGTQAYRFAKLPIITSSDLHNRDNQYEWGSNGNIVNRAIILAFAYDVTGDKAYVNAAINSMDYILGRNANGYSFVTGYGMNPAKNPHHRFWAKLLDPIYPTPIDGVLLGGPNSRDISAVLVNGNHTSATSSFAAMNNDDNKYFLNNAVMNKCLFNDATGVETAFAPQKCFVDNPHSFATSEVAINWNAPLAWITQYLYEYGQQP